MKRPGLYIGVIGGLLAVGLGIVLYPLTKRVIAERAELKAIVQEADDWQKKRDALAALERNAEQIKADEAALVSLLPAEAQTGAFFVYLDTLKNEFGLSSTGVAINKVAASSGTGAAPADEGANKPAAASTPSPAAGAAPTGKAEAVEYSFTTSLTGPLEKFLSYLNKLEHSGRLVTIASLAVNPQPSESDATVVTAQVQGSIYTKTLPKAGGAGLPAVLTVDGVAVKKLVAGVTTIPPLDLGTSGDFGRSNPFLTP